METNYIFFRLYSTGLVVAVVSVKIITTNLCFLKYFLYFSFRGTSYNRGLSVLPADSEDRKQLLLVLSEVSIAPEPESNDSEVSVQSVLLDDLEEGQMEVDEKKDAKDVKNQSCSSIDMFDLEEADGIVENRMTGKGKMRTSVLVNIKH